MERTEFSLFGPSIKNPGLFMTVMELRRVLAGCNTILDVGSGTSSPLRFLRSAHLVGIDGHQPSLDEAKRVGTHDDYYLGNVLNMLDLFKPKSFDACAGMDIIEHLQKQDGWKMIEDMEKLARKTVVLFTPNGFMPQKSKDGDLQEHLSGWTAEEFRSRGYRVYGMLGPKNLRGEYHMIRRSPKAFWALVSTCAHYLTTRQVPEKSAAIMAIKRLA